MGFAERHSTAHISALMQRVLQPLLSGVTCVHIISTCAFTNINLQLLTSPGPKKQIHRLANELESLIM